MKPKTYILQKDSIFAKAGDEFIEIGSTRTYNHKKKYNLIGSTVEDNPEWFKLKEEERPISRHAFGCHFMGMDVVKINDVEYINKKDAEAAVFEYINNKMPHGQ